MLRIRANPEIKISIAVVFTVASVLLIFGIWTIARPSPDWHEDEGFRYNTWFATNAMLEPSGTLAYSFDATEGQFMDLSISALYTPADGRDMMVNVPPSISVNLTDSESNTLLNMPSVTEVRTFEPVTIKSSGEHRLKIVNNDDRLFSIGIRVTSVEKSPVVESFGLMLSLMSIPIFLLGAWLFMARGAK